MSFSYVTLTLNSEDGMTPVHYDIPEPSSLSFEESAIVFDFFRGVDKTHAEAVISELVKCRAVSDVVRLEDGIKVHVNPFADVPASLMKRIDRLWIEELCLQS